MDIQLPEKYAFVRKKTGKYHIARRNRHTQQPIHLSECSLDVGAHKTWSEQLEQGAGVDLKQICKKCGRSAFGLLPWLDIQAGRIAELSREVKSDAHP